MKPKIFITRDIPTVAEDELRKHFIVEKNVGQQVSKEQLIKAVQEYDGILSMLSDQLQEDVLQHAQKLRVISNYAIGLDNIDVEYAKNKGIAVYNLPDLVTDSTADLTLGLLLAAARMIPEAAGFVKDNKWQAWDPNLFCGDELRGKTLGIVGFGRVGKAVAERAVGFGLNIMVYSRSKKEFSPKIQGQAQQVSFTELLRSSDYVSIHAPLTSETKDMFALEELKQMKNTAILLNMGRGSIVNTNDLQKALEDKIIRAAALDVVAPEPISNHPLLKLENCLLVPHIGTATRECRRNMAKKAAENLLEFFLKLEFSEK